MILLEKIKKWALLVDQFSLRERILILLTSISIIYFSWRALVFDHLVSSKQQVAGTVLRLKRQIFNLQGQITEVSSSLNLDPIIRLEEKIEDIQKENDALQNKLSKMTEGLISPKEMTELLKNILDRHKNLNVINVENTKATPIFGLDDDKKVIKDAKIFQVYKHGIELTVSGTFFQLRDFLEEAEKLPWKMLWEELEYTVNKYPVATIKIVIKTLSLDPNLVSTS